MATSKHEPEEPTGAGFRRALAIRNGGTPPLFEPVRELGPRLERPGILRRGWEQVVRRLRPRCSKVMPMDEGESDVRFRHLKHQRLHITANSIYVRSIFIHFHLVSIDFVSGKTSSMA